MLEGLSPGLGWKVFSRYPVEFIHPHATEYWAIMAAYLYTTGFPPARIEALFRRHISLFGRTVQDPANLKALFDWLKGLGLSATGIGRLIDKHPLLLQTDVEGVLKPRLEYMTGLGLPISAVVAAVRRVPSLLGIDSRVLQGCVAYLQGLGLSREQVARLFSSQPAVFACSVTAKLEPAVCLLQTELGCEGAMLRRMVAQSGLLSRSPATIRSRAALWREGLGLGSEGLAAALTRFPRLLLYPMEDPKYKKKIQFLVEELGFSTAVLAGFPQYVSYSLDKRIAPRTAAVRKFTGQGLLLSRLSLSDAAFCRAYGIESDAFAAFVVEWRESEDAAKWMT
jgi:mTERF domain-containing protein, mitochondrial